MEPQVGPGESHIKGEGACEWMPSAEYVDKDSDELGGECGYCWQWKHGQSTWGEGAFSGCKAVCVVLTGGRPVASRRRNGSWGASLTSHVKAFEFQSMNDMESVNNLSR